MSTELLQVRKDVKKRKPTYKRVQANQYARFKNDPKWRRPKGMGNKDRRNRKGHIGTLKVGYGSPSAVKGFNKDGYKEVLVYNVEDLAKVDSKEKAAVVASSVGKRKKVEILKEAQSKKIVVANAKSIEKSMEAKK